MDEQNTPDIRHIRRWSCHKLECFTDYVAAYAKNLANDFYYLELYASGGQCSCSTADCTVDDSAIRALKERFARYLFVVETDQDAKCLRETAATRNGKNLEIITGNCNSATIIRRILDHIPRSASSFAFIDPPGYRRLRWKTIERLARHGTDWKGKKMDLLIVFPMEMALLRNLTRPECEASINRLYGSRRWQDIRQEKLSGTIAPDKVRQRLVALFRDGLKGLGYRYATDFKPVSLSSRTPFYHLIWASDRDSGTSILEETWGKPRYLPCELLYQPRTEPEKV
jgi:three-Cys-motif partner protein